MTGKYKLYVGLLQDIPGYCEFSYYDSLKRRLFLLCNRKPEGKFAPVPEDLRQHMTPDERRWLNESYREINRRWMAEHEEEAAETANVFLDILEEELKKEAEKAAGENDGENEDETEGSQTG